ncbi:alpha/beta-hydrolase [Atractiella rhizophila]|nr:alpha/beta-hydrolase [Atractiella rhizophila]
MLRYIRLRLLAALFRALAAFFQRKQVKTIPTGVTVTRRRIRIPSREQGRSIEVDVYEKEGTTGVRPVHINFHGGGYVLYGMRIGTEFCYNLAMRTGAIVLDADYRKSPENVFPAAFEDVLDVIAYARSQPASFDQSRISLSGFSAGATLIMSAAVNSEPGTIQAITAIYGNPDLTTTFEAPTAQFDSGMVIRPSLRKFYYDCLLQDSTVNKRDTKISPFYADAERWPKRTMIICGEADNLWEANRLLVEKLRNGGRSVDWMSIPNEAHIFDQSPKTKDSQKRKWEMYNKAADFITQV